jgi:predicted metal-dependent RNase
MMSAGPFVAVLKCSGNVLGGISVHLHGKEGLHLITLHNILEYMQIAIIQTDAADFEN